MKGSKRVTFKLHPQSSSTDRSLMLDLLKVQGYTSRRAKALVAASCNEPP